VANCCERLLCVICCETAVLMYCGHLTGQQMVSMLQFRHKMVTAVYFLSQMLSWECRCLAVVQF